MKMLNFLRMGCLAGWAALVVCGCSKGPSLAEIEARERTSRLYTNAMEDLQAGRLEPAIKGFERVVLQEPQSYSAHFQLATLLQDVRKDYISAIAHYRAYLALRPVSEKATVAQDRVKLCETLLQEEMVRKAGGSASNKLVSDNVKLTAARDSLAAQVKKLEAEVAKLKRDNQRLETESKARSRTIAQLRDAVDGGSPATRAAALKNALAALGKEEEEIKRRRLNPSDADLLDDEEEPPKGRLSASDELQKVKGDLAKLDAEPPPPEPGTTKAQPGATAKTKGGTSSPFDMLAGQKDKKGGTVRPETYTVQEGDTLFKISQRFYGSSKMWHQIQDANRAIVPADGRVRAGQVLKLP